MNLEEVLCILIIGCDRVCSWVGHIQLNKLLDSDGESHNIFEREHFAAPFHSLFSFHLSCTVSCALMVVGLIQVSCLVLNRTEYPISYSQHFDQLSISLLTVHCKRSIFIRTLSGGTQVYEYKHDYLEESLTAWLLIKLTGVGFPSSIYDFPSQGILIRIIEPAMISKHHCVLRSLQEDTFVDAS